MKKLFAILMSAALLFLSGCSQNEHASAVQSNICSDYRTSVMRGRDGFYYNAITPRMALSLKYYDIKTDKTIYLCAKPECLHDGNIYCTATSKSYTVFASQYYEDNIYLGVIYSDENGAQTKLIRAAKDGTELTEIASFGNFQFGGDSAFFSITMQFMAIHKGKAYVPYEISGGERTSVKGIEEIDIDTGAHRTVIEKESNARFSDLTAEGDTVYFQELTNDLKWLLHCYNVQTGELKSINAGNIYGYTAVSGSLLITTLENDFKLQSVDPLTGNITDLSGDLNDFHPQQMTFDGQYIYAFDKGIYTAVDEGDIVNGGVFSADGNKLCEFEIPIIGGENKYCFSVENGVAYVNYFDKLVSCPVSEILSGNCQWTDVMTFENEVSENA